MKQRSDWTRPLQGLRAAQLYGVREDDSTPRREQKDNDLTFTSRLQARTPTARQTLLGSDVFLLVEPVRRIDVRIAARLRSASSRWIIEKFESCSEPTARSIFISRRRASSQLPTDTETDTRSSKRNH
ncbi:hypothetical protein EYF80_041332 [Liparis tanakae]|uniref:Uncharacterized protein n=1 Tax=Liparis tanakae TaxID=230148 RepID=A0A4Z2G4I7_9TELE|nr:hypothetical protein EYF80_041332 [Liparis tanakae]